MSKNTDMPDDRLRILLIEDNPGDARYIREMLDDASELGERALARTGVRSDDPADDGGGSGSGGGDSLTLIHETRLSAGLDRLREDDVAVVLLDLNLPDSENLETLTALRRVTEAVPIIVLTGVRDREMGIEAFHEGADEYLVKAQINSDLLVRSIYHAIVHKRDERELKRQRDRLRAKSERLDEFAGVVAHDLRNPLSVAAGALELARQTGDEAHLERVEDALDRMDALIDDLLILARQGNHVDDPRPVDLESAVRDAWAYVATDGVTLDTEDLDGADPILADRDRLVQVLENLFRNTTEHGCEDARTSSDEENRSGNRTRTRTQNGNESEDVTPTGSRRSPHAEESPGRATVTVRVGRLPSGFYVEDTGPGIPESERERVFEAGYTTDRSGTGFGLSIVREIAGAHGWNVAVVEGDAGGARFEFTDVERA